MAMLAEDPNLVDHQPVLFQAAHSARASRHDGG